MIAFSIGKTKLCNSEIYTYMANPFFKKEKNDKHKF